MGKTDLLVLKAKKVRKVMPVLPVKMAPMAYLVKMDVTGSMVIKDLRDYPEKMDKTVKTGSKDQSDLWGLKVIKETPDPLG
jgi:hypothetical protein